MKRAVLFLFAGFICLIFAGDVSGSGQQPVAGAQEEASTLRALLRSDSFREAGAVAGLLLRRSRDPETNALCGLAFLKTGRVPEAEAIFREVLSLSPDNPEAHFGLGRIGRIRNDPEAATMHLRRAVWSKEFCEEAFRQLWRMGMDRGIVSELIEVYDLAKERFGKDGNPVPLWLMNGVSRLRGYSDANFYEMSGGFERISVPLLHVKDRSIRMISLRLNGKRIYPFDIDSASADFLTVSPLLAKDLGLRQWGNGSAAGVGTGNAAIRFSMLDSVEIGSVTFKNVPVMVSDLHPHRGLKKGLIGTGFLKRFNCTIDVRAGTMDFFPLDRPDLFEADIDPASIAADLPLYLFDAAAVEAVLEGAPRGLYILDSAASTNLVDSSFYRENLKPTIDPIRIVPYSINGALGPQRVNRIANLSIKLGSLVFDKQTVNEFPLDALNSITGRYTAGLLGNPVLWPYRVHFDFRAGRLILEEHREPLPRN